MFLSGADVNFQPILLLHASSHDSINLGADRSDGVHGGVLCKCEEREVYSRKKKKKIALFMCPTSQLLFQSSLCPPSLSEGTRSFAPGQSGPCVTDTLHCCPPTGRLHTQPGGPV